MNISKNQTYVAKPIIKWAGGKTNLLPTIRTYYPRDLGTKIRKYIEPFFGGGALFFDLYNKNLIDSAIVVDKNPELILLYKTIQECPDAVMDFLFNHEKVYHSCSQIERTDYFYRVRTDFNHTRADNTLQSNPKRAAQIIFLNRTCFNGLFRVNAKQEFNVPHGQYLRPKILDSDNIYAVSKALQCVEIIHGDFENICNFVSSDSFIYYDPPYKPISKTANFTSYTGSFFDSDQVQLSEIFKKIHAKGIRQMLSNSDPFTMNGDAFFTNLYAGFYIHQIMATRRINACAGKRGAISELLITNYVNE